MVDSTTPKFKSNEYFSTIEGPNCFYYKQNGNYFKPIAHKQGEYISEEDMMKAIDSNPPQHVIVPMEGQRFLSETNYNPQQPGVQDIFEKRRQIKQNHMDALLGEE